MKKDIIESFVKDRLHSIEQHLLAYQKDKVPERLHQLRVDIKQIKAITSFVEFLFNEKADTGKLKPVFEDAGDIRELQINIRFLSKLPRVPESIIIMLRKKEKALKLQFIKRLSKYIKDIHSVSKKVSFPSSLPGKLGILKYFDNELKKAWEELDNRKKKGLHKFRMRIKKMMYVYGALPSTIKEVIHLDKDKIDELQLKLGAWHDTYFAIGFLNDQPFADELARPLAKLKALENRLFKNVIKNLDEKVDAFQTATS